MLVAYANVVERSLSIQFYCSDCTMKVVRNKPRSKCFLIYFSPIESEPTTLTPSELKFHQYKSLFSNPEKSYVEFRTSRDGLP
jgi:hypothetical protein